MVNLCVFASGSGSNFIELYKYSVLNKSKLKLSLLISNKLKCGAIDYARNKCINYRVINSSIFQETKILNNEILKSLKNNNITFIALAGYLKKIPLEIVMQYERKILNIHPSLLPKYGGKGFYGKKVHEAVINSGESKTGVSIHFVDRYYDKGPIIYQEEIPVLDSDNVTTLASKVLKVEHRIYKKVIQFYINQEILWVDDKPIIKRKK